MPISAIPPIFVEQEEQVKKSIPEFAKDRIGNSDRFPVVGIGASAGGLEALKELFENLPKVDLACVVVQHLHPAHKSLLAEILSRQTQMTVREAVQGETLNVNCVYTIPPDTVIRVSDGLLHLSPRNEVQGLFLPIDQFFRSLAGSYRDRAVGIVLSGGGSDGSLGIQEIKECGGTVFVQDEKSAKFFSMPQGAIATGAADFVLSPRGIAEQLGHLVRQKFWMESEKGPNRKVNLGEVELQDILRLVHKRSGMDFTSYKFPTLSRRISRRMNFRNAATLADYKALLVSDADEVKALCQEILIQVTMFFREPATYEYLKTAVFPGLVKDRRNQDPIRIWVAGCSSGEEAYSILISLSEFMKETNQNFPIQVFGTDINESAIHKARSGSYLENAVASLSTDRLHRFFVKESNRYVILKEFRNLCIFAKHNVLSDPPFARIDLLSCQNVLIYFDATLQKRVLSLFQYALKPSGVLLLGPAETAGANPSLFSQLRGGTRAYTKAPARGRPSIDFGSVAKGGASPTLVLAAPSLGPEISTGLQVQREADRCLLAQFAPPGVIFNGQLEVIQFRGQTGPYFEHSPGFANLELLKMLKGSLISDVRLAINQVLEKGEGVRRENIKVRLEGETVNIAVEIFPLRIASSQERFFLLTFENMDLPTVEVMNQRRLAKKEMPGGENTGEAAEALRAELKATKDYLQSVNEDKDAANEELKAANEEIMSSNEELQSTNEELHTAKEELQSTNEELLTVNDELRQRNQEFRQLNGDLTNLFTSLNVAVVILNKDLRIRKFTPMAEKMLRLVPGDIGRLISDIRLSVEVKDMETIVQEVVRSLSSRSLKAQDSSGRWYSVEIRPYRTAEDRIEGAILIYMDISEYKTK